MSFCLKLFLKNFSTTKIKNTVIKNVTVIGGGLMGGGIAQVAAQTGHNVLLVDLNKDILQTSKGRIEKSLNRVAYKLFPGDKKKAENFTNDTLSKIKFEPDISKAVSDADLVIEAVIENLDAKHQIFKQIDQYAPKETIFATNTSSFLVDDIANVTNRLDRFAGLHFFNPVAVMKLLEVIKTPYTSQETQETLLKFGATMGKTTVEAKDTIGFIVNRLLVPYLFEAIRMYERGDASCKDIDTAMKLGLGYPMGPFELIDYTGVDTCKFIMDGWHKKYPHDPMFNSSSKIDSLILDGKLGVKTGEGFYKYKK